MTDQKPLLVTAAIIHKKIAGKDKILIAQRTPHSIYEANKWEFPGGKVEFCEDPKNCIVREISEELKIDIEVEGLLGAYSYIYHRQDHKLHVILVAYMCRWKSGECKNIACQDSRFIDIEDWEKYDFVAGDVQIVKDLLDKRK